MKLSVILLFVVLYCVHVVNAEKQETLSRHERNAQSLGAWAKGQSQGGSKARVTPIKGAGGKMGVDKRGLVDGLLSGISNTVKSAVSAVVSASQLTSAKLKNTWRQKETKIRFADSLNLLGTNSLTNLKFLKKVGSTSISSKMITKVSSNSAIKKKVRGKSEGGLLQSIGGVLNMFGGFQTGGLDRGSTPIKGSQTNSANILKKAIQVKMALSGIQQEVYHGFTVLAGQSCTGQLDSKLDLDKAACSFKCMTDPACTGFIHDGQCQLVKKCEKQGSASKTVTYFRMKSEGALKHDIRQSLLHSHVVFQGSCAGMNSISTIKAHCVADCLQACDKMEDCRVAQMNINDNSCDLSRTECTDIVKNDTRIQTFVNLRAMSYEFIAGKTDSGKKREAKSFTECQKLCNTDSSCRGYAYKFGGKGERECEILNQEVDKSALKPNKNWYTYTRLSTKVGKEQCAEGETLDWVRHQGVTLVMDAQHREMVVVDNFDECQNAASNSGDAVKAFTYSEGVCTLYMKSVEAGELICKSNSVLVKKQCKPNADQKSCKCSIYGDPHYRTFDDQLVTFQGRCKYTVAQSKIPNDPCHFKINVKNTGRGQAMAMVTWVNSVEIEFADDVIVIETKNRRQSAVKINDRDVTAEGSICKTKPNRGYYQIVENGRTGFLFEIPMCGIKIRFSREEFATAILELPPRYRGGREVAGLCGNCNNDKPDDLVTRKGKKVQDTHEGFIELGNSWIVHDKEATLKICEVDKDYGCPDNLKEEVKSNKYCGLIRDTKGIFKKCIADQRVDHKPFFDACMTDVCAYKSNRDQARAAACLNIAQFVDACMDAGIDIALWRDTHFCPKPCPDNMLYKAKASSCPATCLNPRAPVDCDVQPSEGCVCKEGFVLSGEDCIRNKDCGIRVVGDLTIVVDGTGHLDERNFTRQRDFISSMVGSFYLHKTTLQVQLVKYDEDIQEVVEFGAYTDVFALQRLIHQMTFVGGMAQTSDTLRFARQKIHEREKFRPKRLAPKILVFVTTRDIMEDDAAQKQLTLMALEDIKIILVAMVTVEMEKPVVSYGQVRHLILNSNDKIEMTVKYAAQIVEKEAKCGKGKYYNGAECDDINECVLGICPEDSKCINTDGGYRCYCDKGFVFDENLGCLEINECYKKPCLEGSKCKNVFGTYECTCPTGFSYDLEHGCVDEDECLNNPGICKTGAKCKNTPGSYKCICGENMIYLEKEGCIAKDPCDPNPCACGSRCEATSDTDYKCNCAAGFKYNKTIGCEGYDVCEDKPCIGERAKCTSSRVGKYTCVCPNGYEYDKYVGCIPIDFCADEPCLGDAECLSAEGAFTCMCQQGMYYNASVGCVLPDDLDPIVQSVYVVDGSENMDYSTFTLVKELLAKLTTDIAGTSSTIQQGIVIAWDEPMVVLPMAERVVDHVIHAIQTMEAPGAGKFKLREALSVVETTMFNKEKPRDLTRLLTIVTANSVEDMSSVVSMAQKFLNSNVSVQIVGVGNAQLQQMSQVAKAEKSMMYVKSPAEVVGIHSNLLVNVQTSLLCPPYYAKNGHICQASPKSAVTCEMGGLPYALGSTRSENCVVTKCTAVGPQVVRTECRRADGKCVALGTRNFPCITNGTQFHESCTCKKSGATPDGGVAVSYTPLPVEKREAVMTSVGEPCVFPFVFNGKPYYDCQPHSQDGKSWCSVTVNFDADEQWGYCLPPVKKVYCDINGVKYEAGQTWKRGCNGYKCTVNGTIETSPRCETSEGDCVDPNTSEFPCVIDGVSYDACSCTIGCDGKPKYYYSKADLHVAQVAAGKTAKLEMFCVLDGMTYTLGQEMNQSCSTLKCNPAKYDNPVEIKHLGCERADGSCVPISSKNFPCKIYGRVYEGCECKLSDNEQHVVYSYKSEVGFYKSYQQPWRVEMEAECYSLVTKRKYKMGDMWEENCVMVECIGSLEEPTAVAWRNCETDDPNKKCVPLGSRGFPCKINGQRHSKCSCLSASENRVAYTAMADSKALTYVCVDPESNTKYFTGQTWTRDCQTFRCGNGAFEVVDQQCPDKNNTCHKPGSDDLFECYLTDEMSSKNCKCVKTAFGASLVATSSYVSMESRSADIVQFQSDMAAMRQVQLAMSTTTSMSISTTNTTTVHHTTSTSIVLSASARKRRAALKRRRRELRRRAYRRAVERGQ